MHVTPMRRVHHSEQPGQDLDSRSALAPRTGERFQDEVVGAVEAAHQHAREPAEPRHSGREVGRDGMIVEVHGRQTIRSRVAAERFNRRAVGHGLGEYRRVEAG